MIKSEQLKKVAEYMGCEVQPLTNQFNKLMVIYRGRCTIPFSYNPLQNSDQCLELMEKFKISLNCTSDGIWLAYVGTDDMGLGMPAAQGKAKTINEAVTLAAIAYVESIKESDDVDKC